MIRTQDLQPPGWFKPSAWNCPHSPNVGGKVHLSGAHPNGEVCNLGVDIWVSSFSCVGTRTTRESVERLRLLKALGDFAQCLNSQTSFPWIEDRKLDSNHTKAWLCYWMYCSLSRKRKKVVSSCWLKNNWTSNVECEIFNLIQGTKLNLFVKDCKCFPHWELLACYQGHPVGPFVWGNK